MEFGPRVQLLSNNQIHDDGLRFLSETLACTTGRHVCGISFGDTGFYLKMFSV